jgi:transposase
MQVQHILRSIQPQPGFVYSKATMSGAGKHRSIRVHLEPRKGAKAVCSGCCKKRAGYDKALVARSFVFVPLWGMACTFVYRMRRVNCPKCGIVVELVPWATGKQQTTDAYAWFIANWAKSLSWAETARRFGSTWDIVFRCVQYAVQWGLANRSLDGIACIGVDELAWKKGHKYMTLVYQIDHGRRRLLHIAKDRTIGSFNSFFDMLGDERSKRIQFVASDMWRAFLNVVRNRCGNAVHVLDRFHVAQLLSKAVDEVRRDEARSLRKAGKTTVLTKTRWLVLKAKKNLKGWERTRLRDLVKINLRTVRAYLLKEQFQHFWTYTTVAGGRRFLAKWTTMAMRSRLPQFKVFARTLRTHQKELLNWFLARGSFASGATEGFNNKARVATRKAYGFRTYENAEIALYHTLGDLPEPPWITHRFS